MKVEDVFNKLYVHLDSFVKNLHKIRTNLVNAQVKILEKKSGNAINIINCLNDDTVKYVSHNKLT